MNRRRFLGWPSTAATPSQAPKGRPSQEATLKAAADVQTYTQPLSHEAARHLVTRTEFGARLRRVNGFIGMTATEAVDFILQEAEENALPEAPSWYKNKDEGGTDEIYDLQKDWMWRMKEKGFIERMTYFLHNHLVTGYSVYGAAYHAYTYYKLLRTHALGNFKDLVHKIGMDPAMLYYLDNNSNVPTSDENGNPAGSNENYARELLELFTMGQYYDFNGSLNYTEGDIKQIARVLTGWFVDETRLRTETSGERHDAGNKTIWGETFTGSGDPQVEYDKLIDLLFEKRSRQIAHYLCKKMYVFFIDPVPDEAFINELAIVFESNDFELKPVLHTLLTSQRFFDAQCFGCRIKSPIDFLIGFLNETETAPSDSVLEYMRQQLEPANLAQELFEPPNVAGWPGINPPNSAGTPGDEMWLTTSLLPERWNVIADLTSGAAGSFDPLEVAIRVSDPANPFKIAEDLARTFVPIPLDVASIREVGDDFAGDPDRQPPQDVLDDPIISNMSKVMLGDMPHYEWPDLIDGSSTEKETARIVLQHYIALLSRELPEYQLH